MKILVINWQDITNPLGGGAETHFHEIFKRIAAMGHKVTLFCCSYDGCIAEEVIDGIHIIRAGSRLLFNLYVPIWYYKKFKNEQYDIIVDDINKIPFYTPLYVKEPLLAISHHFFGTSIFLQANPVFALYVYVAEKLVDFIYKSTKFTVVSQSTLNEFLARGFNKHNFTIIPNAITQTDYPMQVTEKYDIPTITYFGRIKKYKSPDHLVKAFSLLLKEIPNAKLLFMGSGDFQPELEHLAKNLGIEKSVEFKGRVTELQKTEYLSKSWVVVNTSMKEGWGITNIEANACGTPVISANVPGLSDSVRNGVSGELYEYGNIQQLHELIKTIVINENIRIKLSEGAVSWAKQFSWDTSALLMIDYCKKIIENSISVR
ncbi:MAG: glycosyltransferase family 4 protein [Candidatus Kapaibacterium sp.]|nr:glycosyltransferase family 4 protein [Bacteroidota bacterium]